MKVDAARLVAGMGIRPMGDVYDETDNTWPMVVVQWRDTHAAPGTWVMTEDYEPEEVLPISVGWVWPKKKEGFLTLVGTVVNTAEEPEMVSDVTTSRWRTSFACSASPPICLSTGSMKI